MLKGRDWCFHLAALSNDGSADISEDETRRVNVEGTRKVAEACLANRVPMIYASTASVYGSVWFELSREDSRPNPVSSYARSKADAEKLLQDMAFDGLRCIILRQATIFGWSPRMRYDLVVNALLKSALTTGKLVAQGGGEVWRPLVYVGDLANVWLNLAETRTGSWWAAQVCHCPVFNVAHHENDRTKPYRISELVWWMHLLLKDRGVETKMVRDSMETPDRRDYAMDATRLQHAGFLCSSGITTALDEMLEHIRAGECADFESDLYYNTRMQRKLLEGCPA